MTRKDYELIASVLRTRRVVENLDGDTARQVVVNQTLNAVVVDLARELSKENERFNFARFLDACGVNYVEHSVTL